MFGQLIPIGGFKGEDNLDTKSIGLKSMKTQELKEHRMDQIYQTSDMIKEQARMSRFQLEQCKELKQVLSNFSFKEKNQFINSSEINWNILDELRRERKIIMVLQDTEVEKYLGFDMTKIDINDES